MQYHTWHELAYIDTLRNLSARGYRSRRRYLFLGVKFDFDACAIHSNADGRVAKHRQSDRRPIR